MNSSTWLGHMEDPLLYSFHWWINQKSLLWSCINQSLSLICSASWTSRLPLYQCEVPVLTLCSEWRNFFLQQLTIIFITIPFKEMRLVHYYPIDPFWINTLHFVTLTASGCWFQGVIVSLGTWILQAIPIRAIFPKQSYHFVAQVLVHTCNH